MWQDGEADRRKKGTARNLKVKHSGLLWGPRRRRPPGEACPAAQRRPAGACTGPQEAHGEGRGREGLGRSGQASPYLEKGGGGKEEVHGDREETGAEPRNGLE